MSDNPRVGTVIRIVLPGDVERRGKVLEVYTGMVLIKWVDYRLPDEWIPVRWLT